MLESGSSSRGLAACSWCWHRCRRSRDVGIPADVFVASTGVRLEAPSTKLHEPYGVPIRKQRRLRCLRHAISLEINRCPPNNRVTQSTPGAGPCKKSPLPLETTWTAAELVERLGPISLARIRYFPLPGQATEADLLEIASHDDRLYELIDGTLVEKTMGNVETLLAVWLITSLSNFVTKHDLGLITAPDGTRHSRCLFLDRC